MSYWKCPNHNVCGYVVFARGAVVANKNKVCPCCNRGR